MAMIMWVGGLGSKVLFPNVKPDQGTVLMMSKLLSPFGAAFGMVGILAAIMSTAAGLFLIVAVSIAVDIYHDTIFPGMKNPPPKEVLERRVLWMKRPYRSHGFRWFSAGPQAASLSDRAGVDGDRVVYGQRHFADDRRLPMEGYNQEGR